MSAKRGPYRKCYLVPHRTGFKYCRAVPKDLQPVEQKKAWVKYLGAVSRPVAETMAHALAHEHGKRILAYRGQATDYMATTAAVSDQLNVACPAVLPGIIAPPPIPEASELTLLHLVALWEKVRAPRSATGRAKTRRCVRRFYELVGNIPAEEVGRRHAVAYRDALEDLSWIKPKNATEHLECLHVIFAVAMSEGLVGQNPFSGVKVRASVQTFTARRQGFTEAHVRAIFDALTLEPAYFAWVVRLLAFHGMRSGEACQLRCNDVTVLHGVPVLRIHDLHGSVKNRASVRDIPIHPACMEIMDVADKVAAGGDDWLFPAMPLKARGRGHWFQDYGSRFIRKTAGISDRRYTMHSFRHLWRTLARECEMPESVSRSIMGHTLGGGEHGAYGGVPSLKLRAEWIAKIDPLAASA